MVSIASRPPHMPMDHPSTMSVPPSTSKQPLPRPTSPTVTSPPSPSSFISNSMMTRTYHAPIQAPSYRRSNQLPANSSNSSSIPSASAAEQAREDADQHDLQRPDSPPPPPSNLTSKPPTLKRLRSRKGRVETLKNLDVSTTSDAPQSWSAAEGGAGNFDGRQGTGDGTTATESTGSDPIPPQTSADGQALHPTSRPRSQSPIDRTKAKGLTTRQIADRACRKMIELSGVFDDSTSPLMILDNGCGSSASVTTTILSNVPQERIAKHGNDIQIVASDSNETYLRHATRTIEEYEWAENVFTMKMEMQNMGGFYSGEFTHVFSNFSICLSKDADGSLHEIYRVLRPNGVASFSIWSSLSWITVIKSALQELYPDLPSLPDEGEVLTKVSNGNAWHSRSHCESKLATLDLFQPERGESVDFHEVEAKEAITTAEFLDTFGGKHNTMIRSLLRRCFVGTPDEPAMRKFEESIVKEQQDVLARYFDKLGIDTVQLEMKALIIIAKKGNVPIPRKL